MWRTAGLVIGAAAAITVALVAYFSLSGGGGGSGSSAQACFPDRTAAYSDAATVRASIPQGYSVDEAKQRVDWFRFPSALPETAIARPVYITHRSGCPNAITVEVRVDGPGYWFVLTEAPGGSSDPGTPISVDGTTGQMLANPANYSEVWWNLGERLYMVHASYGGELTQERLLEILNSMR